MGTGKKKEEKRGNSLIFQRSNKVRGNFRVVTCHDEIVIYNWFKFIRISLFYIERNIIVPVAVNVIIILLHD